jgi:murein DD-endopeptidase MepM/ murein hydrolase activator NlpD
MAKIKYYYDTETCQYQRVKTSLTDTIFVVLAFIITSFVMATGLTILYNAVFPSEAYVKLEQEKKLLETNYQKFDKELSFLNKVLASLQERDDYLYRGYFDSEPLPKTIREGGTGGTDKYRNMPNSVLIQNTAGKIEELKRRLYVQAKSLDEIVHLAQSHSERTAAIPSIMPLTEGDKRFISGFGVRMHPIYRIFKMHTGCDFTAPIGTPVYATGDGVVVAAEFHSGYGNQVEIDHGFGFHSTYSHLSAFDCRPGQKVKRGQIVGRVGSTGVSVSPHLHYEITRNGMKINPIQYFYSDMNPTEYEELLEVAGRDRPSMGN